jgi:hypothetical protein
MHRFVFIPFLLNYYLICHSVYIVSPMTLPFHRLFLHLRYRRSHWSHMRLDRFRRSVAFWHTTDAIASGASSPLALFPPRPWFGGGSGRNDASIDLSDLDGHITSDRPFMASQWLYPGAKWRDTLPPEVKQARDDARRIPASVLDHVLPHPSSTTWKISDSRPSNTPRSACYHHLSPLMILNHRQPIS